MRLLDIHSHVLPSVDDGAKDIHETISLLEELKKQGVTDVLATPHFAPAEDNFEEYESQIKVAKEEFFKATNGLSLPNVYFGCEVFYFPGMGTFEATKDLSLGGTNRILIEFGIGAFDSSVLSDINKMREELGLIPVIAHIERYKYNKGFEKLLGLVENGVCEAQVNAGSIDNKYFSKIVLKLLKNDLVTYIGSDTHSIDVRPPKMAHAYQIITERFGKEKAEELIKNGEKLIEKLEKAKSK